MKFRLTALAVAVALMGALIFLATLNSERRTEDLRTQLSQVDSESFRIAERFKDTLREVADKMLRYRTAQDPAAWDEFLKASHELDLWIDQQKPKLKTQPERDILLKIDAAYDDYLDAARNVHLQPRAVDGQNYSKSEFAGALAQARRHLSDLGQKLAEAHFASRNQLLSHARQTLTQLHRVMLTSLGLLFVFGVSLATMVYRDMIAPLRIKLVASQELAERNEKLAALGMLAAGVAHEIRNPLTAIKAALFIQQKKFQIGSQERADAELIEREILRLEKIISDFLQFARPREPDLAIISAELPLREVQLLFTPQLAKEGIQLLVEASAPLWIKVDAEQIKQVLLNLVQNAADSIGRDGTIKLRARADRRVLRRHEMDVVILEVADTGRGISAEVAKRLFDPFFTTKDVGTGLGLSIAARIVEKHGGILEYQTRLNHGTTFGIILPKAVACDVKSSDLPLNAVQISERFRSAVQPGTQG